MNKLSIMKLEKAVRLISEYLPVSDKDSRKSILFHDIRVGVYLHENRYSEDIVLAGLLHDAIEWSDITVEILKEEFGGDVAKLVLASTKNKSIEKSKRNEELIKRCVKDGQDALIVKAADTIDSFKWYYAQNNKEQLTNHCLNILNLIFKYKPKDFNDKIFEELREWKVKFR